MRWKFERSETGGKCKHITVYCECYCMCHCFNSPQGRADKGKNESSSPRQNYWKCLGLRSTAGPEESKRKTFTIHAQSSSQWARRDLNKNSFESKDEVSAVNIT